MNRIGFLLKVKEDMIEDYKDKHKDVWPELLDALRETGWHNYSIFMRANGELFGYFETPDSLQTAIAKMSTKEINRKWQEMMATYFEIPTGSHADEMMLELEEVFHLD